MSTKGRDINISWGKSNINWGKAEFHFGKIASSGAA
jgi:hypothetical protein